MLTGIDVVEKVERQGLLQGAFVDHFGVARRSARPAQEVKTVNKCNDFLQSDKKSCVRGFVSCLLRFPPTSLNLELSEKAVYRTYEPSCSFGK